MNEYYYHLCPISLTPGSVIKAGNWGRIIRTYMNQPGVNWWLLFREQSFELMRVNKFPDKPSRLNSAFLFEHQMIAEQFKQQHNRPMDVLHKVKVVDQSKPHHRACMNLVELTANERIMPKIDEQAHKYWSGTGIQLPEFITESDIEVVEEVKL